MKKQVPAYSHSTAGRWQIQQGDIWRIGPHILACGDLEQGMAQPLLELYGPVDLCLTQLPPYTVPRFSNHGVLRKQIPSSAPSPWKNIVDAAKYACKGACLEVSGANLHSIGQLASSSGGKIIETYDIFSSSFHSCKLIYVLWFGEGEQQRELKEDFARTTLTSYSSSPAGMDEAQAYGWFIEHLTEPGDLIFDPCLGQGLTTLLAHQSGRRILGLEFNPRRVASLLDWFTQQPRIGRARKVGILPKNKY